MMAPPNIAKLKQIVLASGSTARAKMFRDADIAIEIRPSDVDERRLERDFRQNYDGSDMVADLALALSAAKALTAARALEIDDGSLVIGSDQLLVWNGNLCHKTKTISDLKQRLKEFSGTEHHLISAAVIVVRDDKAQDDRRYRVKYQLLDRATIKFRNYSEDFVDQYLRDAGTDVLASVGGYGIEGRGAHLIDGVEGDTFTIMGLPWWQLLRALRAEGAVRT